MFKRMLTKAVSMLLVFAMVFESAGTLSYALGKESEKSGLTKASEILNSSEKKEALKASDATIVFESVKRREEYVKGYRLTDGSEAVFLYPFSVFEKKTTGEYVEIDNTLRKETDENGEILYTADTLEKKAEFYEKTKEGETLKITTGKGSIKWGLLGVNEGIPYELKEPEKEEGYSKLTPKSVGSILQAKDIKPGIDQRLQLVGKDAEENIIINDRDAAETVIKEGLTYKLSLKGCIAEEKDSEILIYEEGKEEASFILSASYMEDAEGLGSTEIELKIEKENGDYYVRVKPGKDWLLSDDRTYPITIDPTISQRTSTKILRATTVTSNSGYDPQYKCGTQHCGKDGAYYGKMRVALQFDLPAEVSESDMVIDAGIIAKQRMYSGASGATVTVNAHRITTTAVIGWNFKWSTLNGHYESLIQDSQTLSNATKTKWAEWDISKAVKDWYQNGGNNGIALVSGNEDGAYKYIGFISPYDTGVSSSNYPVISVTYLNQEGLESYLSCHSAGSSTMGSVSVCDFNGNLIYALDDISIEGGYLPLSIQHVYNHSQRGNSDLAGTSMHYGEGFRLNLSQKITEITDSTLVANGYCYTLTDEDGTVHYFRYKSGTALEAGSAYEKEFESRAVLTKTSEGFTLDYNEDLLYTFDGSGYLIRIEDRTSGKSMSLKYSSGRLIKVTDGSLREAVLTYNSSGYLTSITDPSGRTTSYTYSSGRLTGITRPDGSSISLTYEAAPDSTYVLKRITDIDSSKLEMEYYPNAPLRTKSILEKGTSGGEGGKLTFTYGGGETTVTDREGLSETMQFDAAGHTVCIKDSAGNAYFGTYEAGDDNNKHSLSVSSKLQASVTNYIKNHDFETTSPSSWNVFKSTDGQGSLSISTEEKYLGERSLKIESSLTSGYYGAGQIVTIPGVRGRDVTVSAKVKITELNQASSTNGLCLRVWHRNSDGGWSPLSIVKKTAVSSGWEDFILTASVPENAASDELYVRLYFYNASGTCYIDCIQAEKGAVSNRYNLLENGHFNDALGEDTAEGWSGTNLISGTDGIVPGYEGGGFKLEGRVLQEKYLKQTINVSGSIGDSYVYGAYGKADAIKTENTSPHLTSVQKRPFGVTVRFVKADNTYSDVSTNFEAKTSGWQYLSGCAVAPFNYVKIEFILNYTYQKNTAVFDNAHLYRDGFGDVIEHDDKGRVSKVTNCMGEETLYTYAYENRPEVASITYPDGSTSTYAYDANKRLTAVTDSNSKTANYAYDSSGNNIKVSMTYSGTTLSSGIKSFGAKGYLSEETDSLGNTTLYTYDENKGLLTKAEDPSGSETNYTYNASNDLLTGVIKQTSSAGYTYSNMRLTGLSHTAGTSSFVNYTIGYNQFGERTFVKVGTNSLASYTYAANNGKLLQTAYGNGTILEPVYDEYNRKTGLKVNGNLKYRWHYGADGNIGLEEDIANGKTKRYLYDSSGRLTSIAESNGDSVNITYDASGKAVKREVTTGANVLTSTYSYNAVNKFLSGTVFKSKNHTVGTLTYAYDAFERASRTLTTSGNVAIPITYSYYGGTESNTTTLIPKTIKTALNGSVLDYRYTYDSRGNISKVEYRTAASGSYTETARYTYDSLNQLVREDNASEGKTFVYSYDKGGNILSAKEYAYTLGTLGTVLSTKTYSYGDSNWKDKLTGYAGSTITYDNIGNPLVYRGGMSFTWQNGRELATSSIGGVTTTYTYNSSGIRASKTVGTVKTSYVLDGDRVAKSKTGDVWTFYYYDETGSPIAFRTNETGTAADYYYVKNLQGDIVAIVNASGTKVAEYTYNAWGKVFSVTGSLANSIGASNPYRYRGYWYDNETGLYYLQSRYYDPTTGRFINADGQINSGVLGSNLFAYCLNNPVAYNDSEGNIAICSLVLFIGTLVGILLIPSSHDISPELQNEAKQKYNENTVSVSSKNGTIDKPTEVNILVYGGSDYTNVNIDKSLEIHNGYEQEAILSQFMESNEYDVNTFGSMKFMKAQWDAHNFCYSLASSGPLGYKICSIIGGSENPLESSRILDIRSKNNMIKRQKIIYEILSIFE